MALVAHVRYSLAAVEAVREMVHIAERPGVRVLISHMRNSEALPAIDDARARGPDVQFDTYPYNAGRSMFLMYLPYWAHEGGQRTFWSVCAILRFGSGSRLSVTRAWQRSSTRW
jgi:hypothetical protein